MASRFPDKFTGVRQQKVLSLSTSTYSLQHNPKQSARFSQSSGDWGLLPVFVRLPSNLVPFSISSLQKLPGIPVTKAEPPPHLHTPLHTPTHTQQLGVTASLFLPHLLYLENRGKKKKKPPPNLEAPHSSCFCGLGLNLRKYSMKPLKRI